MPSDSAPRALAHTHARARLHAHRAGPGWHARSIIGMRDLQAAAARICVCEGGRGDCRQNLPRTHSHTHARARLHAHRAVPGRHARSIIGMRDLQAAAARICICKGGRGDCRQILPRTHSHTLARTLACQPTSPLAYLGVSRGYRASERRVGTAKSPSIQCISASAYRPDCLLSR